LETALLFDGTLAATYYSIDSPTVGSIEFLAKNLIEHAT